MIGKISAQLIAACDYAQMDCRDHNHARALRFLDQQVREIARLVAGHEEMREVLEARDGF